MEAVCLFITLLIFSSYYYLLSSQQHDVLYKLLASEQDLPGSIPGEGTGSVPEQEGVEMPESAIILRAKRLALFVMLIMGTVLHGTSMAPIYGAALVKACSFLSQIVH